MKNRVTELALLIALLFATTPAVGRADEGAKEQTSFSSEQDFVNQPVQSPTPLSAEALSALATDRNVAGCLAESGKSPDQVFAWFVASVIHLGPKDEADYIVLPNLLLKAGQPDDVPGRGCFLRANAAWFWALRRTKQGYKLVFSGGGHELSVLRHRTNGFRDIKTGFILQAGQTLDETVYRFDGQSYVQVKVDQRPLE
jgi:hypothetical protein